MKVLVTGASGFVGSRLTAALEEAGHEVRAMTRRPESYEGPGTPVAGDVGVPGEERDGDHVLVVPGPAAALGAEPADVVTSPQAAMRLLVERVAPGSTVLVVGGDGLVSELEKSGFVVTRSADEQRALVQSFVQEIKRQAASA